jgi:uncharacterized protein (TIGR03083 family)
VAAAWADASDLPRYSVGGVAGHLVRAVGRLEATLDGPAPEGDDAPLTEWYLDNRVAGPEDLDGDFPTFLRDDGERLAAQGPDALTAELDGLGVRLAERLAAEDAGRRVAVVLTQRPVPLVDYLGSRLVEVVVHADDIAVGAGVDGPRMPAEVVDATVAFLLRLARARSGDLAVVRAMTRAGRVADPADVLRVL